MSHSSNNEPFDDLSREGVEKFTDTLIDHDSSLQTETRADSLSDRVGYVIRCGVAALAIMATLTAWNETHRPKSETPTFAATKVDSCYVSDDWKWVSARPNYGIDDLVLHNVDGVTSENGNGGRCLNAARIVVKRWANNDDYSFNNIRGSVEGSPTIFALEPYAVPLFASPKPQG